MVVALVIYNNAIMFPGEEYGTVDEYLDCRFHLQFCSVSAVPICRERSYIPPLSKFATCTCGDKLDPLYIITQKLSLTHSCIIVVAQHM